MLGWFCIQPLRSHAKILPFKQGSALALTLPYIHRSLASMALCAKRLLSVTESCNQVGDAYVVSIPEDDKSTGTHTAAKSNKTFGTFNISSWDHDIKEIASEPLHHPFQYSLIRPYPPQNRS